MVTWTRCFELTIMSTRLRIFLALAVASTCLILFAFYHKIDNLWVGWLLPVPQHRRPPAPQCTPETTVVRKDWNAMTDAEKRALLSGMRCLQSLPSIHPAGLIPAAESLFDDFVAVHISVTPLTHKTAIFLAWHRHFIWLMEQALHAHCHYPRLLGIPYWNWAAANYSLDTLFGAADPGFGGAIGGDAADGPPPPDACVTDGPFANLTVRFGPLDLGGAEGRAAVATWKLPRPQCLARAVNRQFAARYLAPDLLQRAFDAPDVDALQEAVAGPRSTPALHGWGHFTVGGQMADSFCASADPVFYLLHSMVDRLWTLWQAKDEAKRRWAYCCEDTKRLFFDEPARKATPDTPLEFGVLGGQVAMRETMDPTGGRYCYRYD